MTFVIFMEIFLELFHLENILGNHVPESHLLFDSNKISFTKNDIFIFFIWCIRVLLKMLYTLWGNYKWTIFLLKACSTYWWDFLINAFLIVWNCSFVIYIFLFDIVNSYVFESNSNISVLREFPQHKLIFKLSFNN